ncbi:hypothetical protein B0H19DRAFT_1349031 [Mycena capillaripes]|nr:hypothetical protein B0H19DRAFT_951971 [Mycena capillaripes]KAJ6568567.1 hypothetical protein B0H19DRAFT_1349031 [Mycena capillaripes]
MSSFNVFGFFALADGKRIGTKSPGSTFTTYHNHYITSLKTASEDESTYPAATVRVWSGSGDAPLPDYTVAFIVAKASAPVGQPIELDVLFMAPIPGDPNDAAYEAHVPICPAFVYGVGHIPTNHAPQTHPDDTKTFTLSLTEYVNGTMKSSAVEYVVVFSSDFSLF